MHGAVVEGVDAGDVLEDILVRRERRGGRVLLEDWRRRREH